MWNQNICGLSVISNVYIFMYLQFVNGVRHQYRNKPTAYPMHRHTQVQTRAALSIANRIYRWYKINHWYLHYTSIIYKQCKPPNLNAASILCSDKEREMLCADVPYIHVVSTPKFASANRACWLEGSLLGGSTGCGSPRRRLTRTGDHGVAGPLGDWLLSLTSTRLSIMTTQFWQYFWTYILENKQFSIYS